MKKLLLLAVVLIKGNGLASLGGDASRRKKRSPVGSVLLFGFLAVYLIALMVGSSITLYDLLAGAGLQDMLVGLYLSLGVVLVFLFGILYVISIFYYSSDVEKLLPLPLQASDIIGAKLLVTAAYEYLYLLILILPPLLVYGIRSQAGPLYYLALLIDLIALPAIPLCLASVLVMLIMRFTPLARNKDRFNLFSGLLAMGLALAFVFGTQSMASFNEQDLARIISAGTDSIAKLTTIVFPGTSMAVTALTSRQAWTVLGQLALLILIAAAVLFLTLKLAGLLYFRGVIGLSASASGHRRLNAAEWQQAGKRGSAFWTYVLKDVRILVRTPIFFMNNVMMNFLWPIFFLIPLLAGDQKAGLSEMIMLARQAIFQSDGPGASIALAVAFGAICFVAGTNGITESALSREGRIFYIMKIVPMSYLSQLLAKITVGVLFSLCGALLPVLAFVLLLQPPLWFAGALLAIIPGAVLLPNLAGIIFELFWPKLNWDNEQKAVKQNMNVLYGMVLALLLAALVIAPTLIWQLSPLPAVLLIGGGSLLLAAACLALLRRIGSRRMLAIES